MYPIVYGHTLACGLASDYRRAKPIDYSPYRLTCEKTDSRSESAELPSSEFMSNSFSWLPTDFEISSDGKTVRSLGYINNLHPVKQKRCYTILEKLIARFIPMWERVLGETAVGYSVPTRTSDRYIRVRTRDASYYKALAQSDRPNKDNERNGEIQLPYLVGPFVAHPKAPTVDLKDCTLQIIIKMANIYLVSISNHFAASCYLFGLDA